MLPGLQAASVEVPVAQSLGRLGGCEQGLSTVELGPGDAVEVVAVQVGEDDRVKRGRSAGCIDGSVIRLDHRPLPRYAR